MTNYARTFSITAAFALAASGLSACGSSPGSSSSHDGSSTTSAAAGGGFRVLALLPLSGPLAAIGAADKASLTSQMNVINAAGSVNGGKVSVTFVDDAGTGTQAISVLQRELGSGTPYNMVFDGSTSTEAAAVLPLVNQRKLLNCTVSSTSSLNDPTRYPYTFGVAAPSTSVASATVAEMVSKGYRKVSAVFADTELGQSALSAMQAAATKAGIQLTATTADPASTDITAQLAKVGAAHADALLLDAYGPLATVMLKSAKTAGTTAPIIGDDTFAANDLSGTPAADLQGVSLVTLKLNVAGSSAAQTQGFESFNTELKKQVSSIPFAEEIYAGKSACMSLGAAVAIQTKGTDPANMKAWLETVQTPDQIPGWFLTAHIGYSTTNHFAVYTNDDYTTVPAGARQDGVLTTAAK